MTLNDNLVTSNFLRYKRNNLSCIDTTCHVFCLLQANMTRRSIRILRAGSKEAAAALVLTRVLAWLIAYATLS